MKNRIARKIVKRKDEYTARGRLDLVRKAIKTAGPARHTYVRRRRNRQGQITLEQLQERLKQGPVNIRYYHGNNGKKFFHRWLVVSLQGLEKAYGEIFHPQSPYGEAWSDMDDFHLADCSLTPYKNGYWNASNWIEFDE